MPTLITENPPVMIANGNHPPKGIASLLETNALYVKRFNDPARKLLRQQWRAKHPTEIGGDLCIDGRVNIPAITGLDAGLFQPIRSPGGNLDLGWIGYQMSIERWVEYAISRGRNCLRLVTSHESRGDTHRGCAAFDYNTPQARESALRLKQQYDYVFGRGPVYAVPCVVETDLEALILIGNDGQEEDMAYCEDDSTDALMSMLRRLFPDMPYQTAWDFVPLLQGNVQHSREIQSQDRDLSVLAEHAEGTLAFGRGLDWLTLAGHNTALIVGPYGPDVRKAITTGASVLLQNIRLGRTSAHDNVLLCSAPFWEASGYLPRLAQKKAWFLQQFARQVIKENHKIRDLEAYLDILTVTVNMATRQLTVLENQSAEKTV